MLLFSGPDFPEVELGDRMNPLRSTDRRKATHFKLFTLKDIAIGTTRLTRTTGDSSIETTRSKLCFKQRIDFSIWQANKLKITREICINKHTFLPLFKVALYMVGKFFRFFSGRLSCLGLTLLGNGLGVLLQVKNATDQSSARQNIHGPHTIDGRGQRRPGWWHSWQECLFEQVHCWRRYTPSSRI